jgi:CHASE3 domain sensor protein
MRISRSRLTGSIGSKLGASFGLVVVLLLGLCGLASWGLSQTTSVSRQIDRSVTPRLIAVDDVRASAGDVHFSQTRAVFDGTKADVADFQGDHATFEADLQKLKALATSPSDRAAMGKIDAAVAKSDAIDTRMFGLLAAGHHTQAIAVMNNEADDASDVIVETLSAYQSSLRAAEQHLASSADSTATSTRAKRMTAQRTVVAVESAELARCCSAARSELW